MISLSWLSGRVKLAVNGSISLVVAELVALVTANSGAPNAYARSSSTPPCVTSARRRSTSSKRDGCRKLYRYVDVTDVDAFCLSSPSSCDNAMVAAAAAAALTAAEEWRRARSTAGAP